MSVDKTIEQLAVNISDLCEKLIAGVGNKDARAAVVGAMIRARTTLTQAHEALAKTPGDVPARERTA